MKTLFTILMMVAPALLCAQSFEEFAREQQQSFEEFKAADAREFKEFRDQINREYAEMMRQSWQPSDIQPAIPQPKSPKPVTPTVASETIQTTSDDMPVSDILRLFRSSAKRAEIKPIIDVKKFAKSTASENRVSFMYYGASCSIDVKSAAQFKLSGIDESGVASAWERLSTSSYDNIIVECIEQRERLNLCDWAYFTYIGNFCDKFCGAGNRDESTVMQMYILTQSGYRVRIARGDSALCLLIPFDIPIFNTPYINLDGEKLYVITKYEKGRSFAVFNQTFPNEQQLSLFIESEPKIYTGEVNSRELTSKRYSDVKAEVSLNNNLVDFYRDYPRSDDMSLYVTSSLSNSVKESLYPALRQSLAGKTERESVNRILNFVQTSLEYQTDDVQFGVERPLFGDETLFYPYCDCEDRAILFSILVKDLVGLDVVLLSYPRHLAAAVLFEEQIEGDFVSIQNKRYIICDPTYIGASVGCAMPEFKKVKASVMVL